MRLNQYLAQCGVSSRRGAEYLITSGQVKLNGAIFTELAYQVSEGDLIEVEGKLIKPKTEIKLWALYKPRGYICTNHDPQGRPTIFELLPEELGRVISVGRLDMDSEGLILLTNSGEVARQLELPQNNLARTYQIRIYGKPTPAQIAEIESGICVDGVQYLPAKLKLESGRDKRNIWAEITLFEGKNREVRRIFEHIGCPVNRLRRETFGTIRLGRLPLGELREIKDAPAQLKSMLGENCNYFAT